MSEKMNEKVSETNSIEPVFSFTREDLEEKKPHVLATITSARGREIVITNNVDQAMQFAIDHKDNRIEIDEATNKRILRKIDLFVLPVVCLLYAFQYMDKTATSYSSILGLRTSLNMQGDMYSWTTTCFYLGYLVFEFPASFLLQRFPLVKTVSVFIILWGMILALCAVPEYPGFIALRTILGALESSVTPAFAIVTSQWYKQEEQFLRTAWWFSSNGIGTIVGLGISYGLYENQGSYSLPAWKLVFVITGVLTIFLGFLIMAHIPDTPTGAWFLSEEEKVLVVERARTNQQGFGNPRFKKSQFIEALTDHRTWLYVLFGLAFDIPNGGITSFSSILLNEDFGFSTSKALLMNMPMGAIEIVGCPLLAYLATYIKSRMLMAVFATSVAIMLSCLLAFAPSKEARLAGLYLFTLAPIGPICILSQIASSVAGHTKKVTVGSLYLIGYCVGNLIGPQTFIASQAPGYQGAKVAIVVCTCFSLFTLVALYISYYVENKRRDSLPPIDMHLENYEFADLTDRENPHFRYAL
ncbi:conserved hypothetical protein [Lodderomyces elongisporus NRRL YB-4239]|uniref:Major facilitator superfamily (MFS) profile domain-containing protein n=1 Tax=Lodderomyces elongisporus (strain ATCC 11503 / CBS 2605 / JCM 1781 / NBRC 1676 / NRRL YB-4239) TaxID=379508 RepID=A5E314_LODEL|nr:conserved hypothetical protein [Lodderomyces elongisporus NRRL YB-4239]